MLREYNMSPTVVSREEAYANKYFSNLHENIYRIRPNYRVSSYKRTVKQFSNLKDYNRCTFIYFFIKKHILWVQQVEAIQTSTHNIWFYKENRK